MIKKPEKLTDAEEQQRLLFIGNCIDKNLYLPTNTRFGVAQKTTVQDLTNSSVETLQAIGSSIKKAIGDHDPEFSNAPEPMLGKLSASKWVEFIRLTIKRKRVQEYTEKTKEKIKQLQDQINEAKTPQEKRAEAEAQLAELQKEEL